MKNVFFLLLLTLNFANAETCETWFQKQKLPLDASCEAKCIIAKVDMSTFDCHDECEMFCKHQLKNDNKKDEQAYSLLKKYGLTDDEIKICDPEKKKCIQAYLLSLQAETLCLDVYPKSATNDESDACRHFVWAHLLARDIDFDFAEKVLNAHENNPDEPLIEKSMDLANNRFALLNFQKKKNIEISNNIIISDFKESMKNKKLIVIKPRYEKSEGLP